MGSNQTLNRQTFRTSRELEYFSVKELTLQTGHEPDRWAEVVLKELVDNSLDACEEKGILPEVEVRLESNAIIVKDNGPGLPCDVVKAILDFNIRVSSKDAYISPTRGAQGNALKTVVAIPYVLSGCQVGEVEIASLGERHFLKVKIDHIAQRPVISHEVVSDDVVKNGTQTKIYTPLKNSSIDRFLQILSAYALFNPHASFELKADGRVTRFERTTTECRKWLANEPTSAHWYSANQLRSLMAAYIAAEGYGTPPLTVREFISEFRGLSGTAKQKAILTRLNLAGVYLHDLVKNGDIDKAVVPSLLAAMQTETKPVRPLALGAIGEEHFRVWIETHGGVTKTFKYQRMADVDDKSGLPFVVEIAFALREDHSPRVLPFGKALITGINWAPTLVDPFRQLRDYGVGLDGLLNSLYIYSSDPVTFILHLACPHLNYTDRGKSALEVV